jgi:hypothetical protein
VNNKTAFESCFAWWVPYVIQKQDRIIGKIKARVMKQTHKFGIEIPRNVKHALDIDQRTGTTFWHDAINKEMKNVSSAFEIREDGKIPPFYKEIVCHLALIPNGMEWGSWTNSSIIKHSVILFLFA